ncbi:MAG: AMP-binding protein [Succinivibrio sp.]
MLFDFRSHGGDAAMVSSGGRRVTYAELDQESSEFARCARRGSLALMLCANSVGMIACYAGFIRNGIVPILLGGRVGDEVVAEIARRYRPSLIVWREDGAGGSVPNSPDAVPGMRLEKLLSLDGVAVAATGFADPPVLHPDLALLLSTSGSTGSPKLVRISRMNLEANARSIVESLGITADDTAITALPMNYSYGLSVINTRLMAGAGLAVTDSSLMQKPFWDLFEKSSVTSFSGVPYSYAMLRRLGFLRAKHGALCMMDQAGGHLPEALQQEFALYCASHGARFFVMYGQTEATARMACLPSELASSRIGCAGRAVPGGEFSVRADGGGILGPMQEGRLFYQGPNVAMGYAFDVADLVRGDEWHGVLDTGDNAVLDEGGFLYLRGRSSRFVKLFGNRVGLDECAQMLERRFPGAEAACTGRDDLLLACIAGDADPNEARAYLAAATHIHQSAFKVVKLQALPRSSSGKILYSRLPSP